MSKQRSKKSKQQRRQRATAQRRAKTRTPEEPQIVVPKGPLSPGDRINLMIASFGLSLDSKPFAARLVALGVDYLLCGMLTMTPVMLAIKAAGISEANGIDSMIREGMSLTHVALVVVGALLVSCVYYVVIPLKLLPGKTPGKYCTHRKVVMQDGSPATLRALLVRWAVLTFCETISTFASSLLIQFISVLAGSTVGNTYNTIGAVATAISAWLVFSRVPKRLALHDYAAGTEVRLDR